MLTSSATLTMEESLEKLAIMYRQETDGYQVSDWLDVKAPTKQTLHCVVDSSDELTAPAAHTKVDRNCRDVMTTWCMNVADFCNFQRETVEVALSFLDRFMMNTTTTLHHDRSLYRLACMAALYTAVKVNEPRAMDPVLVARLSRGAYEPKEIEEMESEILSTLKWRMNPPTAMSYVRILLDLIPEETIPGPLRPAVLETAQFQTELAVLNYDLITVPRAMIACAAILNSLECIGFDEDVLGQIHQSQAQVLPVHTDKDLFHGVRGLLYEAVTRQQHAMADIESSKSVFEQGKMSTVTSSVHGSPRCVMGANNTPC